MFLAFGDYANLPTTFFQDSQRNPTSQSRFIGERGRSTAEYAEIAEVFKETGGSAKRT